MKRKYILLFFAILLVVLSTLFVSIIISEKGKLSNQICDTIDDECDYNNECVIKMDEITDFAWDKMLLYEVMSSETEISKALGVEFKESVDLSGGMVFVKDDKVVYHESFLHNPDHLSKLQIYVGLIEGEGDKYPVFTPDDAIFVGSRREIDGKYRYWIKPNKNNQ